MPNEKGELIKGDKIYIVYGSKLSEGVVSRVWKDVCHVTCEDKSSYAGTWKLLRRTDSGVYSAPWEGYSRGRHNGYLDKAKAQGSVHRARIDESRYELGRWLGDREACPLAIVEEILDLKRRHELEGSK